MTGNLDKPDIGLLADLDAGLLDETTAREVRAAAAEDPAARAVLEALAATRAELATLPEPPVPPELAARWSAALAAEHARLATPTPADPPAEPASAPAPAASAPADRLPATATRPSGAPPAADPNADAEPATPPYRDRAVPSGPAGGGRRDSRSRPPQGPARRPARWVRRPAVHAAALLIAVAVVAGLRAHADRPPTLERPQLVAEALSAVGIRDTAGLTDPTRRAGCLRAVGAPVEHPDAPLLGGRRVAFEGDEGVLLVLGTGQRGAFDVLIVDPDCGPSGGKLLLATRITPQ